MYVIDTHEPFKGTKCSPSHIAFTAAYLADILGYDSPSMRTEFLQRVHANTETFYRIAQRIISELSLKPRFTAA